ncbi:hypothetical protein [Streptomyces sp. WMMC897]|uniref:hypothetical protein n=1 Tax=Streptomyces sp. WMMC897 TaxID=3014782 RepID=UPI0022B68FC6|nr:hypothetical protein [Streptomyces sp. WMMC897]MCZ7414295.1 hypothetical protein [Streptomyces sp. WMMC897]
MTDPFVPKGPPRAPGDRTCGHKAKGDADYCGQPGTWHVMWDAVDNSVSCDKHMTLIRQRWVYDDRHPIGADCTMPGALWLYHEHRCGFPDEQRQAAISLATTRS